MVTISDVADKAGVSIKTVSRVINEERHVRDVVRNKVQIAIQDLGYVPNIAARRLASSRSFMLTLLYHNPNKAYVISVLEGMMAECRALGYNALVESPKPDTPDLVKVVTDTLARSNSDGVILTPPFSNNIDLIQAIKNQGKAVVTLRARNDFDGVNNILIDEVAASYQITEHLIQCGHKHVGIIKGNKGHAAGTLRFKGYQKALSDAGIALDYSLVTEGNFSYRVAMQCAEQLLSLKNRPTAIFACNDVMAAAVLAVAQMRQISVPEELAIAGFDDTPVAMTVWPPLTTIRQPFSGMAGEAVRILASQLTRKEPPRPKHTYFPHELIIRGSTRA